MHTVLKYSKKVSDLNNMMSSNIIFSSIHNGLIYMIPLVLIGSFSLVLASFPVDIYQQAMNLTFGNNWKDFFIFIYDGTFNILSLVLTISISYSYTMLSNYKNKATVNPLVCSLVALSSLIALTGISKPCFSITNLGVVGSFLSITVAIISSSMFCKLSSIKRLSIRTFFDGISSDFNYAISSIHPAAITIFFFALINCVLIHVFNIYDIQNFITQQILHIFNSINSSFLKGFLFVSLVHIFWFLGVHGSNILEPISQLIYTPSVLDSKFIVNKTFFDAFILMGGCGATICLVIAYLLTSKHKNQLHLAKISLLPSIFNINELIVFGLPIILNPIFILPFIVVPLILYTISYLAIYYGLVLPPVSPITWTTPALISGYLATGSTSGVGLQLINIIIGTLCYIPFVKLSHKVYLNQTKYTMDKIYNITNLAEQKGIITNLLTRPDDIGNMSRFLANDLKNAIINKKIELFYQPQVDYEENVIGIEALLRWNHPTYGYITPPLIIALAEEGQMSDALGFEIFDTAFRDFKELKKINTKDLFLSINVSASQLENENFITHLKVLIHKYNVDSEKLVIEITEKLALSNSITIMNQLKEIKNLRIKLAMDDFGMGRSSLVYLKEYNFDIIKLDGSIVKELITNDNCKNIISSIIFLSKTLHFSILAEYVENEEQKHILHNLGCNKYQGYLFSKALSLEDLISYLIS